MERDQWFVGIDLGSQNHQGVILDAVGQPLGDRVFEHTGQGLSAFCSWLIETTGGVAEAISVAIESPHGAVVDTLLERGFAVFAINPKQLDRFRDRFTMAGAKDDRRDARVLADSLRTDRQCFRRLAVGEAGVIQLREWSRMTDELQRQRTRLTNRVRDQLQRYYPQALELTDDLGADWFLELWELVPTPLAAGGARRASIAALLSRNRIRKLQAQQVLDVLRKAPLFVAPGTVEAATAHIAVLAAQLRLINQQLKSAHARLDALCAALGNGPPSEPRDGEIREQRDVEILQSLPGVGRIVLATLLAEASQPLRARDYPALRSLCGVAPVTRKSGKSRSVVMRRACHQRLRFATYHWARIAIQRDEASRRGYQALRSRGHSHARAIRGVSDRLLAMACAMLRDGTVYDPSRRKASSVA